MREALFAVSTLSPRREESHLLVFHGKNSTALRRHAQERQRLCSLTRRRCAIRNKNMPLGCSLSNLSTIAMTTNRLCTLESHFRLNYILGGCEQRDSFKVMSQTASDRLACQFEERLQCRERGTRKKGGSLIRLRNHRCQHKIGVKSVHKCQREWRTLQAKHPIEGSSL
jgi:hypothetical protein